MAKQKDEHNQIYKLIYTNNIGPFINTLTVTRTAQGFSWETAFMFPCTPTPPFFYY